MAKSVIVASSETIAERIRYGRSRRGWSQASLSEKSDVPIGTIRNIEQQRVSPKLGTLLKLFHVLDISVDELNVKKGKK
jgi:transcriptional regulator with XRE-family HTH domain